MTKKIVEYKTSTTYVQVCLSDYTLVSSLSSELLPLLPHASLSSSDLLVLPSSVYCSSSSDVIDTSVTFWEARGETTIFIACCFSKYFKTVESRIYSLLLSVHAFLFPTVSKQFSTVSWFNLSLQFDRKVINILKTLSMTLFDNERLKISSTKSKILGNSFWQFLNSWDQTSVKLKPAYCVFTKVWRAFHSAKILNMLNPALSSGSWNSLNRISISSGTFLVWSSSQYCGSIHFIALKTSFSTREENLSLISWAIIAIVSVRRSKASWRLFVAKETSSISTPTYSHTWILWYQRYNPIFISSGELVKETC